LRIDASTSARCRTASNGEHQKVGWLVLPTPNDRVARRRDEGRIDDCPSTLKPGVFLGILTESS
jgi:hypothetical protein